MAALNHSSIIRYVGFSEIDFKDKPYPTIILEYAPNGTLKNIIDRENSGLSHEYWNDTKKLICIYGIASRMSFLHKNNIIHRDLKPENILMDEFFFPKITDFGLSKINDSIAESLNTTSQSDYKGTLLYTSPEVFEGCSCSEKSDVYALALIVYQIIFIIFFECKLRNHCDGA